METEEYGSQHSAEERLSVRKMLLKREKRGCLHFHVRASLDHLNQEETWMEKIRKWQEEDKDLHTIRSWEERPPWKEATVGSKELKSLWARWHHIRKEERLLWYLWEMEKCSPTWNVIISPEGRPAILQEHQDSKMGRHMGVDRT